MGGSIPRIVKGFIMSILLLNLVIDRGQYVIVQASNELFSAIESIQTDYNEAKILELSAFQHGPNQLLDSLDWQDLEDLPSFEFQGTIKPIIYLPKGGPTYLDFSN